jgi:DNA polymerase
VDPGLLARFLRQRQELGLGPLVLEGLDREHALELARAARSGGGRETRSADGEASAAGRRRTRGSEATDSPVVALPEGYEALREEALGCTLCRLSEGRTQVVFADGVPTARLMVVGEAPGANEDRTGLPFVGAAGKLLDLMLASVDLSRERNVYICNVLKCRPPGNRDPLPDEIETCAPYLKRQIALVRPEVILAVGSFAARWLTGTESALGKLRGSVYSYEGVPVVVTYHPAALLRNASWSRATWDDLQLLRQVMEGE